MEELQLQLNSLQNQINVLSSKDSNKQFSNTIIQNKETVVQRGGIQSAEFSTGATGWRFDADGNLEANAGHFRGDVTGASGTFAGTLTGGSLNIPDITSAPSFHVDNTGNIWSGAAAYNIATNPFAVSNAGVMRAISGTIANWNLSTTALSTGAFDTLNTMYFGTSGLSLSNTFKVDSAGALTATGATISGAITATSGSFTGTITATTGAIGGWIVTANDIKDIAGVTGMSSLVTAGDDIRFWAGNATPASAPFYVTEAGTLVASSATITGAITATSGSFTGAITSTSGTIGGFTLSGTNLYAGTGVTRIDLDTGAGISLGASTFATSPFSVSLAGVLKAQSGTIGGTTITSTTLYGGIIQTSATVGAGSNGVILDSAGLRGYDSVLEKVFDIHTDGSAPEFAFGNISNSIFEINTNAILRTSSTVGDGSASSAGILINDTGLYATEANQTLANANVKILIDGSAVIKMNVKGGQTDYNTGTGYFLGLSGGDYKLSLGSPASNYLTWDGTFLKLRGSLDVGVGGLINNSVYTNATLPNPATVVGFNVPSANEASNLISIIDSYSESNTSSGNNFYGGGQLGQSFTGDGRILTSAKFNLKYQSNALTGSVVVKIYAETHATAFGTDSLPTGLALATSDSVDASTLTASFVLTNFNFTGAEKITLTNGTYYVVMVSYLNGDATHKMTMGDDNTSPAHSGNYNNGAAAVSTIDCCFYVYGDFLPFTNPANIYSSNNAYATLPATSGILTVEISKDAGVNWLVAQTVTFTSTDTLQTVGNGATELWGSSFTRADVVDAKLYIRLSHNNISQVYKTFGFATGTDILTGIEVAIEGKYGSPTMSLDLLEVKIHYGTSTLVVQAGSQAFDSTNGTLAVYDGAAWQDLATTSDIVSQVENNITDGHTTLAPSGNAVFDALALKSPLSAPVFTTSIQTPTIELGHTTDSTITRISAGVLAIEGNNIITTNTLPTLPVKATATELVAGTDDAKFATALGLVPFTNNSLYRQAIINGNFDVWQRGTSVALTTTDDYTADRWYAQTQTTATDKTVSRQDGTGVNGSYYSARVLAAQDVDELVTFSYAMESQESIKFRGSKVTLSFYAKGGAEFVSGNATLVSKIVTGKGTDQKVLAFTTSADGVSQNNTLTTGWQKFTCTTTAVIASDITQIGISFSFTHAGTGVTTNYFEVTQVQINAGSVALPFMPKSYGDELLACQRYYEVITGAFASIISGNVTSGQYYYGGLKYLVTKRIAPTPVVTNADRISFPSTNPTVDVTSIDGFRCYIIANATGAGMLIVTYTASAEL